MKKIIFTLAMLSLAGCGMTNEEIIAEVEKCRKADMKASLWMSWANQPERVVCKPYLTQQRISR